MLKTIKRTKQMRLDELIKYAFENNIKNKVYRSDNGKSVMFLGNERFETGWDIGSEDLFTVEIEEEITEDTEFYDIQEVYLDIDEQEIIVENSLEKQTIRDVLNNHDDSSKCLQIYALINEKRELIWESEEE